MSHNAVSLLVALFLLLGATAAQAAKAEKKTAVVLAVFGTSHESGLSGILNIREQIQKELPGIPVRLAFTSNIIRRIWQERRKDPAYGAQHPEVPAEILHVKGPLAAIADLQDEGYGYIVVQPTHISSSEEFADLAGYVEGLNSIKTVKKRNMPFQKILLGRPALGTHGIEHEYRHDIKQVATIVAPDVEMARKEGRALVYFAHGNEHYSTGVYVEFEQVMRQMYPGVRIYVTMVEGFPDNTRLFAELKADKTKKVLLKPFMTVAGDHAKNDMAGAEPDSLKSLLEARNIDVAVSLTGLGESDTFAAIFAQHAKDAMSDEGI
ncbi:MAG TPA: sirohydrochlorin cobaltochelatase [Deltaproteobacteria bacterium]|nr:sirohydrochlorin cobaltochelatase [Deltaproteobacteria bacterium]